PLLRGHHLPARDGRRGQRPQQAGLRVGAAQSAPLPSRPPPPQARGRRLRRRARGGEAMTPLPMPEAAIAAAFAKCATTVAAVGSGRWAVTLSNGVDLGARARLDEGWLLLDAPLARAATAGVWGLLGWNATLGGGARFVPGAGRDASAVRAEMPLDDDVDVHRRVVEMCMGFRSAMQRMHH